MTVSDCLDRFIENFRCSVRESWLLPSAYQLGQYEEISQRLVQEFGLIASCRSMRQPHAYRITQLSVMYFLSVRYQRYVDSYARNEVYAGFFAYALRCQLL